MDKQTIVNELNSIIGDYLSSQGLELIELIYRYEAKDLVLRVLVDKPDGGITLEECSLLNNEIGSLLDEKNILQQRYILEVSSPGLDRPLKTGSDFSRCIGRAIRIFLNEPVNGKIELSGIITKVGNDTVYLDAEDKIIDILLSKINKAKQIIKLSNK